MLIAWRVVEYENSCKRGVEAVFCGLLEISVCQRSDSIYKAVGGRTAFARTGFPNRFFSVPELYIAVGT